VQALSSSPSTAKKRKRKKKERHELSTQAAPQGLLVLWHSLTQAFGSLIMATFQRGWKSLVTSTGSVGTLFLVRDKEASWPR
jgi:hypothetical protein